MTQKSNPKTATLKEVVGRKCELIALAVWRSVYCCLFHSLSSAFHSLPRRYQRLLKYRDTHGDCLVPNRYEAVSKQGHTPEYMCALLDAAT